MKQAVYYYSVAKNLKNRNFFSSNLQLDDFVQEANMGLLIAMEKYDYGHPSGATFNTYSHNWIRQRVQRFLGDNAAQIRMPLYRQKVESYKYRFLDFDDPQKNYARFLQDIREEYNDSTFEYVYDEEYFFDSLKKIINEETVGSEFGYEILCHRYGVDGYEQLTTREISALLDLEFSKVQSVL